MQKTAWQNVFIQTLYFKLTTKVFLYVPGMNSIKMQ